MGRLATGDDGSLRWMRILKRMTANLRLKGSGWLSKAAATVPGNAGVGTARRTHKSHDMTLKHNTHEKITSHAG